MLSRCARPHKFSMRPLDTFAGQFSPTSRVFEHLSYSSGPAGWVFLTHNDSGVGHDIGDFAGITRHYRNATGKALDQNPSKLLTPMPSGLARHAENIHGVQIGRHLVVPHSGHYSHAVSITTRPPLQFLLQGPTACNQCPPRA